MYDLSQKLYYYRMRKDINWKEIIVNYNRADHAKAYFQLLTSYIPYILFWYLAYISLSYSYFLTLFFAIIAGAFSARIFSIMHDCSHGSFFGSKSLNNITGFISGTLTLTPFLCWKKIHATHHACTGKINRRDIGDFELMTIDEYLNVSKAQKIKYHIMRNPLFLLLITPFLLFFILQRLPANNIAEFTKKEKQSVTWTNLSILAIILIMSCLIGFKAFFIVHFPIALLASTVGVFLFFIQHQFENTYWASKDEYNYFQAAMKGSSFFKLPSFLQFFIANAGYHHIHHLSPQIPNYNLKKCHDENIELHDVSTLTLISAVKTFNLKLWDDKNNKLVSFKNI